MDNILTPVEARVLYALLRKEDIAVLERINLNIWALVDQNQMLLGTFPSMAEAVKYIKEHSDGTTRFATAKMAKGEYFIEEYISRRGHPREIVHTFEVRQVSIGNMDSIKTLAMQNFIPGAFDYHHELWELRESLRYGRISEKEAEEVVRNIKARNAKPKRRPPSNALKDLKRITSRETAKAFVEAIKVPVYIPVEQGLFLCIEPGRPTSLTTEASAASPRIPLPFYAKNTESVVYSYRRYINQFLGRAARTS